MADFRGISRKALVLLPLILSVVVLGVSCARSQVDVGVILPLSGTSETVGIEVRQTLEIAGEEVNDLGGIRGRKLELHFRDCGMEPERAIDAFKELEEEVSPLFYISALSLISVELASYAESAEVVLGGIIVTSDRLTQGREWVYRFYPDAATELEPLKYIITNKGIEDLGVIYSEEEWGERMYALIKKNSSDFSSSFTVTGYSTEDYAGLIKPVVDTDAIYIVGFASHLRGIALALREKGYEGDIIAPSTFCIPSLRKMEGSEGIYLAAPRLYLEEYGFTKELKKKFRNKYNAELSHYGASGYDFLQLAADLLKESDFTRRNFRELLEKGFTFFPAYITKGEIEYLQ
jgi:ABC-type branched-subunit amino acid transport system substrate-binding protein